MTHPETSRTVGQRIQAMRRAAGMSQETLAAAVGVSRQALGKWESDLSLPGLDNLLALARALDTSCDELLTGHAVRQTQTAAPLSLDGMQTLLDAREATAAKRRRVLLAAAGAVAAVLACALAAVLLYANIRISGLQDRIAQMDARVSGLSGTLQIQNDSMADRLREMLDAQDAIAAGEEHAYTDWDPETQTLLLTARVTAKRAEPDAQARLVLTAPGLDAVIFPMADAGGGLYTVSGRVQASTQPLTATFRIDRPDGTSENQQLWQDYDIAAEYMLSVELTDGIDGDFISVSTQDGTLRFTGKAGLSIGIAPNCRPVNARMSLDVDGEIVETYSVDVSNFGVPGTAQDFTSITYFWTPEPHPWREGQPVRLTAYVEDDQGVVYERTLELLP